MMNNTPARSFRRGLVTAALGAAGAVAGFAVAIILTLNLHIFAGVEDGYMATPEQVLERSVWILGNVSLGVGALSYAEQFNLMVVADADGYPDFEVFVSGVEAGLHELTSSTTRVAGLP
jgi:hypothetical protein